MNKISSLYCTCFIVLLLFTFSTFAEPIINLGLSSPTVVCATGNDTTSYTVSASGIPANTNIVIYQSTDSTFNPYNNEGDSIGFIPGNAIPKDTINFGNCVKTLGIFLDACGATGLEGRNEYIMLTSGNGIKVSNLAIDFSTQNNGSGPQNADINTNTNACSFKTPTPSLIAGLQVGSCNASNIIPASPLDSIPPNAIILCFTSDSVTASYSVNGLCNLGYPIYVVQNACVRTIGAFTNASRCDAPSRYRTTKATDKRLNCTDNFTYDLCNIFDKDGTYAIRQVGTDTASITNNGIRRNVIDSCGGIDYTQINFTADTTLKFRISPNFCNDGFHYIKAITHPNGGQPISNTIKYKLVCNDISATTRNAIICSGESAIINSSSTNQQAQISWTVSAGQNISGAVAGTGNSIQQTLVNQSTIIDSVSYNISSNDAGCIKTTQVKIFVKGKVALSIDGDSTLCNNIGNTPLNAIGQFDSIRWNTGATSTSININQAGTYSVVAYANACSNNASVVVSNTTIETPIISGALEICDNEPTVLMVDNANNFDSIRWSNGAVGNQTSIQNVGAHSLSVYKNTCSSVTRFVIEQCQAQDCNPTITGNQAFCQGDSIVLDAGAGFLSYAWNTGASSQTIKVKTPGKYLVNVTGQNCTGVDSVFVVVNELPQVTISGNTSICENGETVLTALADADSLRWNNGDTKPSLNVTQAQTYSVTVYKNGCSSQASVQVSVQATPSPFNLGNDTTFCREFEKVLTTGNQSTTWSTGAQGAQITVTQAGTYIATVSNSCATVSDTIVITEEADCEEGEIWLPNAFTPNGDGINDIFYVRGSGDMRSTLIETFRIYNRWGLKVFEVNNVHPEVKSEGWDGKYKGEFAQDEVYGYFAIIKHSNGEKKTLKGNVTLLK